MKSHLQIADLKTICQKLESSDENFIFLKGQHYNMEIKKELHKKNQ